VDVVDGDEQRAAGGQVGGEPVQAVQDGPGRPPAAPRHRDTREVGREQRRRKAGGPLEQRPALLRPHAQHGWLEELPNDTECHI